MLFFSSCKQFFKGAIAIAICALLFCLCSLYGAEKFPLLQGERTYYLDSPSSQGLMKGSLSFTDLFRIKGESVQISLDASGEEFATALIHAYRGEVLTVERVGKLVSYYAYSPSLGNGVLIEGKKVNLHIAYEEGKSVAAVGTPIIFGGY